MIPRDGLYGVDRCLGREAAQNARLAVEGEELAAWNETVSDDL